MKRLLFLFFGLFFVGQIRAQEDLEVKVTSNKYRTVVGHLKKVSSEGIAVEDYKGNYIIFRPNEIGKVKVRRRGLTIVEGLSGGTVGGLITGGLLWSLDEDAAETNEMIKLTAILTAAGAIGGTIVGAVCQIINTRFTLVVNEQGDKFQSGYKNLEKYISKVVTEHVN